MTDTKHVIIAPPVGQPFDHSSQNPYGTIWSQNDQNPVPMTETVFYDSNEAKRRQEAAATANFWSPQF